MPKRRSGRAVYNNNGGRVIIEEVEDQLVPYDPAVGGQVSVYDDDDSKKQVALWIDEEAERVSPKKKPKKEGKKDSKDGITLDDAKKYYDAGKKAYKWAQESGAIDVVKDAISYGINWLSHGGQYVDPKKDIHRFLTPQESAEVEILMKQMVGVNDYWKEYKKFYSNPENKGKSFDDYMRRRRAQAQEQIQKYGELASIRAQQQEWEKDADKNVPPYQPNQSGDDTKEFLDPKNDPKQRTQEYVNTAEKLQDGNIRGNSFFNNPKNYSNNVSYIF